MFDYNHLRSSVIAHKREQGLMSGWYLHQDQTCTERDKLKWAVRFSDALFYVAVVKQNDVVKG